MIRMAYRRSDGSLDPDPRVERIPAALADPSGLLWLDFVEEPADACERILSDLFHFHPLAIDDALRETHVPKVDDWGTYLYLVLHATKLDPAADELLQSIELDLFVGPNYVVTHRDKSIAPLEALWQSCAKDDRILGRGAARLLYHIVDETVGSHLPVVDDLDEEMDRVEERILSTPEPAVLSQVLRIKRALLHLRRIVAPQRETLNRLARDQLSVIEAGQRVYFRDVYDHLVRLHDLTEGLRDLAAGALDTYLSVVNNRMNEVMKTLTTIATLFMPISFLTGFFGMNFFSASNPPAPWTGRVMLGVVCCVTVVVPTVMFLWLRRRRWI
ncbi:MAG TPA: magnesium transporter CorA family protein [Spirochaetia bacterium]|nr:magnesium transporter CorA family protein [Spirochaetia bacterium]